MKKTLVYGTATAVVALTLGSCMAITQCGRQVEALYGPPPSIRDDDEPIEDVYGAPVDAPAEDDPARVDEPLEDLYGAPVDSDDEAEQRAREEAVVALYGTPVDMRPDEDDLIEIYEPEP